MLGRSDRCLNINTFFLEKSEDAVAGGLGNLDNTSSCRSIIHCFLLENRLQSLLCNFMTGQVSFESTCKGFSLIQQAVH